MNMPDTNYNNLPQRIICFNITKSFCEWKRENIYECVRKYWRLSKSKALQAELCLAIKHGKCVGVFRPYIWQTVEDGDFIGRLTFEGEELTDSEYLGIDFSLVFDHLQNPVRYIGNW